MIKQIRFSICSVFMAFVALVTFHGDVCASASNNGLKKRAGVHQNVGLNSWSFVGPESEQVEVVAYLASENTAVAYDSMSARRNKYLSELRLAKSKAPNEEIKDLYEEEIELYDLGYKYTGSLEGWPFVISLPIYSSEGERTGVLIVCRKDQSKYDLVCKFKDYNDSEALGFISDTMNEIFDSLDFAEIKKGEPVFDNEGNLSHPDVLRVFPTTRFLEQH